LTTIIGFDPKDPIKCPYCELKNMKPSILYTLFRDLNDGEFILVKPNDLGLFMFGGKNTR